MKIAGACAVSTKLPRGRREKDRIDVGQAPRHPAGWMIEDIEGQMYRQCLTEGFCQSWRGEEEQIRCDGVMF